MIQTENEPATYQTAYLIVGHSLTALIHNDKQLIHSAISIHTSYAQETEVFQAQPKVVTNDMAAAVQRYSHIQL